MRLDAGAMLDTLEEEVVPLYYQQNGHGYSQRWVLPLQARDHDGDPALQHGAAWCRTTRVGCTTPPSSITRTS